MHTNDISPVSNVIVFITLSPLVKSVTQHPNIYLSFYPRDLTLHTILLALPTLCLIELRHRDYNIRGYIFGEL